MLDSISTGQQPYTTLTIFRSVDLEIAVSSGKDDGSADSSGVTDRISIHREASLALTYSSQLLVGVDENAGYRRLQDLVTNLLKEQGIATTVDTGDGEIDLAALTPARAQELVAEDGFFGVEKTSDRIVDFAKAIAGGDPSRIDAIREGIDRGFEEAKKALGGWLPDISLATYDAVMDKLDHWVSETGATAQAGFKQR